MKSQGCVAIHFDRFDLTNEQKDEMSKPLLDEEGVVNKPSRKIAADVSAATVETNKQR